MPLPVYNAPRTVHNKMDIAECIAERFDHFRRILGWGYLPLPDIYLYLPPRCLDDNETWLTAPHAKVPGEMSFVFNPHDEAETTRMQDTVYAIINQAFSSFSRSFLPTELSLQWDGEKATAIVRYVTVEYTPKA